MDHDLPRNDQVRSSSMPRLKTIFKPARQKILFSGAPGRCFKGASATRSLRSESLQRRYTTHFVPHSLNVPLLGVICYAFPHSSCTLFIAPFPGRSLP